MKRYSLLLPTLLLLAVSACTKDELVPERTETTVTASGALARSAAGEVTVRVSAGAIPAGTQLSITTLRTGQPAGVVGPMFELDTEPRVSAFTGTVELEITNPQPSVEVVLANLDRTPTPVAGATYDAASARARGVLAHFSRYGLWTTTATLSCPSDQPVPGGACSGEAAECRYGEECCCGSCYPSLSCSCVSGQWACLHTDACLGAAQCPDAGVMDSGTSTITPTDGGVLDAGTSTTAAPCPSEGAVIGASCSSTGQICEYGLESCCGQSFPALHCMCDGTSFSCFNTDACLVPQCNTLRESEPNDTLGTADDVPLPLPTYIEGTTSSGDLDWFRVVNTSTLTARFVVDLSTLTSTLAGDYVECHDLVISRYDGDGVALDMASSVRGQRCPSLEYNLSLGAINYLLVHTSTPSVVAPGDYLVNIWPR